MMETSEWNAVLFGLYKECRFLSHWDELFVTHDREDQAYFLMLDELTEAKG